MTSDDNSARRSGAGPAAARQTGVATAVVELTEAVHAALRAAEQGWVAHLEDGPGEADRAYRYQDPSDSRVAAQVGPRPSPNT